MHFNKIEIIYFTNAKYWIIAVPTIFRRSSKIRSCILYTIFLFLKYWFIERQLFLLPSLSSNSLWYLQFQHRQIDRISVALECSHCLVFLHLCTEALYCWIINHLLVLFSENSIKFGLENASGLSWIYSKTGKR